jgi:hypothetical protein
MEQVVTAAEGAKRHRGLFAKEIELGIVSHLVYKTSWGEEKPCRQKACPQWSGADLPIGDADRLHVRDSRLREPLKGHLQRALLQHFVVAGNKCRRIRAQDRLWTSGQMHGANQLFVPAMRKPAMRVDLQEPFLSAPQLHHFSARPAGALALAPVDVHDSEAIIAGVGQRVVAGSMLPADAKSKPVRIFRFCDAVFDRRDELAIAVRCDRDEDQIVPLTQKPILADTLVTPAEPYYQSCPAVAPSPRSKQTDSRQWQLQPSGS